MDKNFEIPIDKRPMSMPISEIANQSALHIPQISLRDYFAAATLTGLLAYPSIVHHNGKEMQTMPDIAMLAYKQADFMLKEREKKDE